MLDFRLTNAFLLVIACLALALPAYAEDSAEDAEVWKVVEEQWNAEEKGDRKWPERLLVEDFSGWDKSSPAPRGKRSTIYWNRFGESQGKMVAHELYPLSIFVRGDIAVAHYLYSSATENKNGEIEMANGRFTDVLTLTDDGWKFLSWHGGDD